MSTHKPSAIINSVIWITSLDEKQSRVTKRITDDLSIYLAAKEIGFVEFRPSSAEELRGLLDVLTENAYRGLRPIIHFDTHGHADTGIHILDSDEDVSWEELIERFRYLNIATENNLCIVSMACFGFNQIKPVHLPDVTPFYLIAGSENELFDDFIEKVTVDFYKYVFDHEDIMEAYNRHLNTKLRMLHSEKLLYESLARYIRAGTMGAGARQRVENLITESILDVGPQQRDHIKEMRKAIKKAIKPDQALLDRWVNQFLLGKPVSFNIDDVVKYAKSMPDPYADGKRKRPASLVKPDK